MPVRQDVAGTLKDGKTFISVPLDLGGDAAEVPLKNGVQTCPITDYDDPSRFPNIAFEMLKKQVVPTSEAIEKVDAPKSARKA